jgi:hypothetical protein
MTEAIGPHINLSRRNKNAWSGTSLACDSRHGLLAGEISQEIHGRELVGNFELLPPMV